MNPSDSRPRDTGPPGPVRSAPPGPARGARTMPALALTDVGRRFGDRWVLRDISLSIAAGERVALLGESGSG